MDESDPLQGSTNRRVPSLVNFVPALAYHFCLNLPAAFTQPKAHLLVEPCRAQKQLPRGAQKLSTLSIFDMGQSYFSSGLVVLYSPHY